jgi:ribonuclease E
MGKQLLIIEKSQLAVVYEFGKLVDLIMEHNVYRRNEIYAGKITSILPSLDAAFITLNKISKNGFLHIDDLKSVYKNGTLPKYTWAGEKKHILVQIKREPTGTKGPSLTSDLHIAGRYLKILPLSNNIYTEKENQPEKEKIYIKAIGHLIKPGQIGVLIKNQIIFTNSEFLLKEIKILKLRWKKLVYQSRFLTSPRLLSRKKNFITKILESSYNIKLNYIGIDSKRGAFNIKNTINQFYTLQSIVIEYHKTSKCLVNSYNIDSLIYTFMKPRININKGAYIVIEKTEALTVIDVNSGSFIRASNSRSTSFWTNYSAATEIVNQIKLRNIGGIIIVDFIDSNNQEDQMKILSHLTKLLQEDPIPTSIIQMSELGLVEITRSRQGQSIYDAFSIKCNICDGIGYTTQLLTNNSTKYYELGTQLTPSFSNIINI